VKKWNLVIVFLVGLIAILSMTAPAPITSKKALGKKLFNDKILSKDSSVSCASCHIPNLGFADSLALSIGIHGIPSTRNTPSVLNMKNRPYYFWDGRAESLEQQSLMPIANTAEMGLPIEEAIKRLNQNKTYTTLFLKFFGTLPSARTLSLAISAYEKTLETDESKFDLSFGDSIQLTESEERGRQLFVGEKAKCFDCHMGPDFTNDDFKNIGLYDSTTLTDKGRFNISQKKEDLGKFKTPSLRNIAITAPYMHNGMFKTLEEVVDFYNNTRNFVRNPINIDSSLVKPLGLSLQEKADLVNFMKTLTDRQYAKTRF
jgi:cytochrome c peroxidase